MFLQNVLQSVLFLVSDLFSLLDYNSVDKVFSYLSVD